MRALNVVGTKFTVCPTRGFTRPWSSQVVPNVILRTQCLNPLKTEFRLSQRFPNWQVASGFVVGREKFLKSLKLNFNHRKLTQFWLSVQQTCPTLSTEALKVLLPFSPSYICEDGFSAMVGMKTKFRNNIQLSNSLRLKITRIDVDVNAVISSNRKLAHQSHTPRYEK
jgi:hypothetical protein